jgi:hypothetical protein
MEESKRRTGSPFVGAFHTRDVLFLLAAQRRHASVLKETLSKLSWPVGHRDWFWCDGPATPQEDRHGR